MIFFFVINDCYWQVGTDTTQVWSSAVNGYVPASDATYNAWLDAGHYLRLVDTETDLSSVLDGQGWIGVPNFARKGSAP